MKNKEKTQRKTQPEILSDSSPEKLLKKLYVR